MTVDIEAARRLAREAQDHSVKVEAAQEAFLDDDEQEVAIEEALTIAFEQLPRLARTIEEMAQEIEVYRARFPSVGDLAGSSDVFGQGGP